VSDEISARDRLLVLALLGAAMVLACLVVFAGTIGSRRDFGRRRALGATRGQLTLLVMAAMFWPALLGAAAGVLARWAYLGSQLGHVADPRIPTAVGVLVVLGLTAISALPAIHAATRDPLRVLRVP
jgi:putative ABC transport system permease protein